MFNLGVPAQQIQSLQQTNFSAVLLFALSFLFFCHPERSRRAFTQKTKKDAAAITHATYNPQRTTYNLQPITCNRQPT
jgi:hypothetical protein